VRRVPGWTLLAIVGFGVAAELARTQRQQRAAHTRRWRDRLEAGLARYPLAALGQQVKWIQKAIQAAGW